MVAPGGRMSRQRRASGSAGYAGEHTGASQARMRRSPFQGGSRALEPGRRW